MTFQAPDGPVVAINAQLLPGSAGGIESNLLALVRALRAVDAAGRQIVIGPGDASSWLTPYLGPDQQLLPWRPLRSGPWAPATRIGAAARALLGRDGIRRRLGDFRRRAGDFRGWRRAAGREDVEALGSALVALGAQVIHFPYQRYVPTPLPSIFEPWDLQHRHFPEFFTREERRFRDAVYRQGCDRSHLVITASQWCKRDLVHLFGIDPGKIAVIRRGAPAHTDREPDQAEIDDVSQRLGLPETFALYPAKTWPHKNHVRLIEALAVLRDRHRMTIPLVCTGRPVAEHWAAVQRAVADRSMTSQVLFTGFVDDRDMRALYRAAGLLVFPSMFEGLGIPLLEAMHHGLPIVTSHATCLPEVAGDAALYFDPLSVASMTDAIATAWSNPALREACRDRGRARVSAFDWRAAARGFVACYRTLSGVASPEDAAVVAALVGRDDTEVGAAAGSSL
jgi:glycosyltransferase involved in cell wall biosynthesis